MSRILIGSIAPNIHGLDFADELKSNDEFILMTNQSIKIAKLPYPTFAPESSRLYLRYPMSLIMRTLILQKSKRPILKVAPAP